MLEYSEPYNQLETVFLPQHLQPMIGFMIQAMSSMVHAQMCPQGTPVPGTPPQAYRQLLPTLDIEVGYKAYPDFGFEATSKIKLVQYHN